VTLQISNDIVSSSLSFLSVRLGNMIGINRRYCYEKASAESYDKPLFMISVNSRDIPVKRMKLPWNKLRFGDVLL